MSNTKPSQDAKKQKTDDTLKCTNNTLGKDQWKWLNEYKSIDLQQWRMELLEEHSSTTDWYYVGNWQPNVAGYEERRQNLKCDKYFYWPSDSK